MREQGAGFLSVSLPFSSPSSLPASAPPGRGSLMPLPPEGYRLAPGQDPGFCLQKASLANLF